MVILPKIHKRDKRETKENGNGFRMSPCRNVLLTRMGNAVLFKIVILESMQSLCAVDGKLISKRVKLSNFLPKILTFALRLPHSTFLNFDRLTNIVPHLATASYFSY